MHACTHTHTHTHTRAHTHVRTHVCTHLYTCILYCHFPTALGTVAMGNSRIVEAFFHFSIESLYQTWDEVPKAKKEVRNTQQSM